MKGAKWRLRYVQKAMAETDVPNTVAAYILQRRRWINGTFFSNLHSVSNFYQIFRTRHSLARKIVFLLQTLYNGLMLLMNWFNVATTYLFFYLLTLGYQKNSVDPVFSNELMVISLNQVYLFSLLACLVASLGNKPNQSGYLYRVLFVVFCILSGVMFYLSTVRLYDELSETTGGAFDFASFFYQSSSFRDLFLSAFLIAIVFFFISLLYLDPWHMITSWLPYSILILCSTNILFVYAFSNISDISWGNRPEEKKPSMRTSISTNQSGTKQANLFLPAHQGEIDDSYKRFLVKLKEPDKVDKDPLKRPDAMNKDEYFKLYRTRLLLAWIISNSLVVLLVTNDSVAQFIGSESTTEHNVPLSFFFYSLSAGVVLKAIGSCVYKLQRVVQENRFL
jgi:chitin synthase